MKRLRSRPRVDSLSAQPRAEPIKWGRRIYVGLILFLGLALLDYTVGDAVVLRAEGLVISERDFIAATYPGKVTKIYVREGQRVKQGDLLFEIESADMLKDIARLATENADLSQRAAELGVRASTATALLPLAERHAEQASETTSALDRIRADGLITQARTGEALGAQYTTAARVAELRSQSKELGGQLPLIEAARDRARGALTQLEAFYDAGHVRATKDGTIGPKVPVSGQVVKFGDELLQIYGGEISVLAYLPDAYLFPIAARQALNVNAGLKTVEGRAEAILTVADALPPEFQNMFRPRDRSRLIRISIPSTHPFAVSQKVYVNGCAFGWCWNNGDDILNRISGAFARL